MNLRLFDFAVESATKKSLILHGCTLGYASTFIMNAVFPMIMIEHAVLSVSDLPMLSVKGLLFHRELLSFELD